MQRQAEIAVALAELRKLPWVDQSAIILYGLGEGARAALRERCQELLPDAPPAVAWAARGVK